MADAPAVPEFRRVLVDEHGWVPWTLALVPWLIFTVLVWNDAWWGFRALLAVVALVAASGAAYGLRPRSTEFVVDRECVRWGGSRYQTVWFPELVRIHVAAPSGDVLLELSPDAAKRVCAPGSNLERLLPGVRRDEFIAHMREYHPGIPIVPAAAPRP